MVRHLKWRGAVALLLVISTAVLAALGGFGGARQLPPNSLTSSQVADIGGSGADIGHLLGDWNPVSGPNNEPAVRFGGTNAYMYTQEQINLSGSTSQAIWFKTTSSNTPLMTFNPAEGSGGNTSPPSVGTPIYGLYISNGYLSYIAPGLSSTPLLSTTDAVDNGQWNFAVFTASSTGEQIWLNGNEIASSTNVPAVGSINTGYWMVGGGTPVGLAGGVGTPAYASANIANAATFSSVLDSTQISNMYAATSEQSLMSVYSGESPAQFWTFQGLGNAVPDQITTPPVPGQYTAIPSIVTDSSTHTGIPSGSSVTDSSASGADGGTLDGASESLSGPLAANSYYFGGSTMIQTNTSLTAPSAYTQSVWFNTTSSGGILGFSSSQTTGGSSLNLMLWINSSGNVVAGGSGGVQIQTTGVYNTGQWDLATVTVSSTGFDLYVNGALEASTTSMTSASDPAYGGWWHIGYAPDNSPGWAGTGGTYFTGSLAGVAIFDSALTSTQVSALYSQTSFSGYSSAIVNDAASEYWTLQNTDNSYTGTAYNVGYTASGPLSGNGYAFNGSSSYIATSSALPGPQTFTQSVWFNTTSPGGLLGFQSPSGTSPPSNYDRMLWIDNSGHLVAGVNNGALSEIATSGVYDNGSWNLATVTLSSAGFDLYVNGVLEASNASVTSAQSFTGYWQIGWVPDSFGWPDSSTPYFNGSIAGVAIYPTALTASQVSALYSQATMSDYSSLTISDGASSYWSMQISAPAPQYYANYASPDQANANNPVIPDGTGFGTTSSGPIGGGAYSFNGNNNRLVPVQSVSGPQTFTQSVWFNTTTPGGIMGFYGSRNDSGGNNHDRMLWIDNSGHLVAGVDNGSLSEIATSGVYDNGSWNLATVTLSSAGFDLYVNGALEASNASVTSAQSFTGYWQVGWAPDGYGWPDSSPAFFTGSIAGVAILPTALTSSQVSSLYSQSTFADYTSAVMADSPTDYWALQPNQGAQDNITAHLQGSYGRTTSQPFSGANDVQFSGAPGSMVSPTDLYTLNNGLTLSVWFNASAPGGLASLVPNGSSSNFGLYLDSNGNLVFDANGQSVTSSSTYTNNKWYQAVASVGSGGVQLYVNGASAATSNTSISANPTVSPSAWTFGQLSNPSAFPSTPASATLTGDIALPATFPTQLTPGDISALYQSATSESAYLTEAQSLQASHVWEFTDVSTPTLPVYDLATPSDPGYALNSSVDQGPIGGGALLFNGAGHIDTTSVQTLPTTAYTVGTWFNSQSSSGIAALSSDRALSNGTPTSIGPAIWTDSAGNLVAVYPSASGLTTLTSSGTNYNDSQWYFADLSVGASGATLYVNGKSVATNSAAISTATTTGYWNLGWVPSDSSLSDLPTSPQFVGSLSNVFIANTAMNASVSSQIANASTMNVAESYILSSGALHDWTTESTYTPEFFDAGSGADTAFTNGTIRVSAINGPMSGTNYVDLGAGTGGVYTTKEESVASNNFTIGGWIKTTDTNTQIFGLNSASNTSSTSVGPFISIASNGDLQGGVAGTVIASSSTAVNTGQWVFVAMTESGTTVNLYVGGTAVTATAPSTATSTGLWTTGVPNSSYGDFFYTPSVPSNLSTISGATTQSAYETAVMSDSPVNFWPISTTATPAAITPVYSSFSIPSLVNNNPLQSYGGSIARSNGYDGGTSWTSSGTGSYLESTLPLQSGGGFGISLDFKTSGTTQMGLASLLQQSTGQSASVYLNSSGQLVVSSSATGPTTIGTATYNTGTWQSLYIWIPSTGVAYIYMNGSLVDDQTPIPPPSNGVLYFGALGTTTTPNSSLSAGSGLANIATYQSRLSSNQISLMNTSMSATSYTDTIISQEPSSYWNFNDPNTLVNDLSVNLNPLSAPVADLVPVSSSYPLSGSSPYQLISGTAKSLKAEPIGASFGYSGYFNITTPGDLFSLGSGVLSVNSSDELQFTNGTSSVVSTSTVPLSSWQLISVEVSPSGTTLYDGSTATGTSTSLTSISAGTYSPAIGGGGFTGYFGDSVLGAPVSPSVISSIAASTTSNSFITSLVSVPGASALNIWRTSNVGLPDNVVYTNGDASTISDPSVSYTTPDGPFGVAATTLPASVQAPNYNYPSTNSSSNLSYGVWFNTQDPVNGVSLVYIQPTSIGSNLFSVNMNSTGNLTLYSSNTINGFGYSNLISEPSSGPNYGNGQWHYLLLTSNSSLGTLRMFVDGSLIGQTTTTIQKASGASTVGTPGDINITLGSQLVGGYSDVASAPSSISYGPASWFNYALDSSQAASLSSASNAGQVGSLPLSLGAAQLYGFLPPISTTAPPQASGITPTYLPTTGGTVNIFGTGLTGATFTINGTAATVTSNDGNDAVITIPAEPAGVTPITITTANGSTTDNITILAPPTITGISPQYIANNATTQITISGTNLDQTAPSTIPLSFSNTGTGPVIFSLVSRTNTSAVIDATPFGSESPGTVILNYDLSGLGTAVAPTINMVAGPVITSVSPANNLLANTTGTVVTVDGQNLSGATLTINGVSTAISSNTGTVLTFVAPSEPSGTSYSAVLANSSGSATTTLNWYGAPTISSITPSSIPEAGATISIAGTNLVPSGSPVIELIPSSGSAINISGDLQSGGSNTAVSVNVPVEPTGNYTLSYQVPGVGTVTTPFAIYGSPSITSVSPATVGNSSSDTLTLTGFFPGVPSVTVGGATASVTSVSSNLDTLTLNMPSGLSPASADAVTYSNNFGSASSTVNVVADPVLTSLSPSSISTGGGKLTITGTGFVSGDTTNVLINGVSIPASSETSTSVTVQVPSGLNVGSNTVAVEQTDIGTSNTLTLTGVAPPTISSISPKAYGLNLTPTITINGSGLANSNVTLNGTTITTTTDTSTSLTFTAPRESSATQFSGVVSNAYGSVDFTLNAAAAPTFNGTVSPDGVPLAGGEVTLDGTGLEYPGTISVSPSMSTPPTIVSQTDTSLTLSFPSSSSATSYAVTFSETGIGSTATSDTVSYLNPPTITSMTTSVQGGSSSLITVTGSNLDTSAEVTLIAQPVVSSTNTSPSGSPITIVIGASSITTTSTGISFYATLPTGYYTLALETPGGIAYSSTTVAADGSGVIAPIDYGNLNFDLIGGPLSVSNATPGSATGTVGSSITASLPPATWTDETGTGDGWQSQISSSPFAYTGAWQQSAGLATTNAGSYVGSNNGVTYTVNVTAISGSTVSFSYSSNYGTTGTSTATVGTATGVGANGITINFASSVVVGNTYTVDAGTFASGTVIINPPGVKIASAPTTVSAPPANVSTSASLVPGTKGAFGTALTIAQAKPGTGMGVYNITPSATININTSSWAATYVANIEYTIVAGPGA